MSERCFGGGLAVPERMTATWVLIGDRNRLVWAVALGGVLERPSGTSSWLVISVQACGKVKSSATSLNNWPLPSPLKVGVGNAVEHDSKRSLSLDGFRGPETGSAKWDAI